MPQRPFVLDETPDLAMCIGKPCCSCEISLRLSGRPPRGAGGALGPLEARAPEPPGLPWKPGGTLGPSEVPWFEIGNWKIANLKIQIENAN